MTPEQIAALSTNFTSGGAGHVQAHNEHNVAIQSLLSRDTGRNVIYASDYPSLQHAIDACCGRAWDGGTFVRPKPLVITPGEYSISAPLRFYDAIGWRIIGGGVNLVPTVDMVAAIDIANCSDMSMSGININARGSAAVENGVWMHTTDPRTGAPPTARNRLELIRVEGNYEAGFRLGDHHEPLDEVILDTCATAGGYQRGVVSDLWKTGVFIGSRDYVSGNNLANTLINPFMSLNNVQVAAASGVSVFGGSFGYCDVDFELHGVQPLAVTGLYSEHAQRFLVAAGGGIHTQNIVVNGLIWAQIDIAGDGQIIQWSNAGTLNLTGSTFWGESRNGTVAPRFAIGAPPGANSAVLASGLHVCGATAAELFNTANARTFVDVRAYTQIDASIGQVAFTPVYQRLPE